MRVKTSELSGAALGWAVATCEGVSVEIHSIADITARRLRYLSADEVANMRPPVPYCSIPGGRQAEYSSSWSMAGPIIEREGIATWVSATPYKGKWAAADARWMDTDPESDEFLYLPDPWHGESLLIAAMRCYVASKLGDEVDVPEELLT